VLAAAGVSVLHLLCTKKDFSHSCSGAGLGSWSMCSATRTGPLILLGALLSDSSIFMLLNVK